MEPAPRRPWISPLNRRRLAAFRAHRRGFYALWIFLVLFGISLFAGLVANDRPLVIRFDGQYLFPILHDYSEDRFGPDFMPTEADYSDPDVAAAIRAHGWMIWPLIPFSYDTTVDNPGGTGWARTTRRGMCSRASSTASASPCCSASR
jgi:microcin C transport system permease protein